MRYTIVTFCTSEYADCVAHWRVRCAELGIPYVNLELESKRDWRHNTRLKPRALFNARLNLTGPILYFDIDGLLLAKPTLPSDSPWDFGIIRNPRAEHRTKISSQCFWIADTLEARKVLAWWDYFTLVSSGNDHPALARTLRYAELAKEAVVVMAESSVKGCWTFNGQRLERSQTTLVTV